MAKSYFSWVGRLFWQHWSSCFRMQWPSMLHWHRPMAKLFAPICTSKGLSNSTNLSMGSKDNLLMSSPKIWWQISSHSWDSHFFSLQHVGQGQTTIKVHALICNGHPSCINIHQWQSPLPPYAPQNACENLGTWAHVAKRTCSQAPQRLGDKVHPTFGITVP